MKKMSWSLVIGMLAAGLVITGCKPATVTVPDVVGLAQAGASASITGAGLAVGAVTQIYSPAVPVGQVISQDPAAGSVVASGAAVALTLSAGAQQFTLAYGAGANGAIIGPPMLTVNYGASGPAVTAVPAAGYYFVQWSDALTQNPRTDANVTANVTVTASFLKDKFALWTGGTHLRGANITQRRAYPAQEGDFLGGGVVGPPYTQADFNRLAALGANYVNISHPGLYAEFPPYALDTDVQNNLDTLLTMAENAGLFAVISARSGPGRSDFNLSAPFPVTNSLWTNQAPQDAWAAMWKYTANRYQDRAFVVGYDLMVEPNSNVLLGGNWWDPAQFYPAHAGSLYDWNQLHPRIAAAVREVDANTPVLVGSMDYSAISWMPYLQLTGDPRSVYTAHPYEPSTYTSQDPGVPYNYPGVDADGVMINHAWLDSYLAPMDAFAATNGVPVAANEFGAKRWAPGADLFVGDMMSLLEARGMNHAIWLFNTSLAGYLTAPGCDDWDFLNGPNPNNHTVLAASALINAVTTDWLQNLVFP